ncbi:amine oxidase, flavin-containing family member protein [Theileria equi strain WA]|uniref:Amine oxidase, flavin-containing family member protein n=1 Tax=Theileria equi strain WA TaxID=1537102 RepID=L1LED3_THEEQ|nr:amine oxidase, flavin-containing family member protein [Theileria equi strain WA]EKX73706.1 amine oxidase, flavin-containing family member protein [Theileria equi strain WA]|eukprot:XP_004833158.1 amine oxidase, flavin-containing family member protein [Theileria equi strain WA]
MKRKGFHVSLDSFCLVLFFLIYTCSDFYTSHFHIYVTGKGSIDEDDKHKELQRWIFLYFSLTDEQKEEIETCAIVKESSKFHDGSSSSDSILDKGTLDYWKRVVSELKSRFTLQNIRLIWNNIGRSVKLRVRIRDSDVIGEDGSTFRIQQLKTMKKYRANAYDRSVVIRDGGVNKAFQVAVTHRNEVFSSLDLEPPYDSPKYFRSKDNISYTNSGRSQRYLQTVNNILDFGGLIKSKTSTAKVIDNKLVPLKAEGFVPVKRKKSISQTQNKKTNRMDENFKVKDWNLDELSKILIYPKPSPINVKFRGSFVDLPTEVVDVLVVGAGIAGLTAANYLKTCGLSVCLVEARNRIGGRAFTSSFPTRILPNGQVLDEVSVDLGANYLHCCNILDGKHLNDEKVYMFHPAKDVRVKRKWSKSLLGLARELKPRVSDVAGGANWEPTVYTSWYNDITGEKINLQSVVKANMIGEKIRLRAAKKVIALKRDLKDDCFTLSPSMNLSYDDASTSTSTLSALSKYDCKGGNTPPKWYVSEGLYREFLGQKSSEYARNMYLKVEKDATPTCSVGPGRKALWDIYIESFREVFDELTSCGNNLSEVELKLIFIIMQSRLGYNSDLRETCISMCRLPIIDDEIDLSSTYLSKKNVQSYGRFISDTFDQVNKVNIVPFDTCTDSDKIVIDGWDWLLGHLSSDLDDVIHLNTKAVNISTDDEFGYVKATVCPSDGVLNNLVTHVRAKYAIICVPSTILSSDTNYNETCTNKISFNPPLDSRKCQALERYRMGHHNKVILRFSPKDVFWPDDELQFNCLDDRFQFMNLHAYGKDGCLLAHSFPPFPITWNEIERDEDIVRQCLELLQRMFCISSEQMPFPVDAIVTRWYNDPYSMGSYSYPHTNAVDDDIIHLKSPHPKLNPRILFAGEYLSNSYYQCVDGAFDTAMRAAEDVAHIAFRRPYPFPINQHTPSLDGLLNPLFYEKYLNIPIPVLEPQFIGYYLTDGSDERLSDSRFSNVIQDIVFTEDKYKDASLVETELEILKRVNSAVSRDGLSIRSFQALYKSISVDMQELKENNYWNKPLEAASILLASMWRACKEYKGETDQSVLNTRTQMFSEKMCQAVCELTGLRHDYICWACLRGGEVLLCDNAECNKVWHVECVPCDLKPIDTNLWMCPSCVGCDIKVSCCPRNTFLQRGEYAADEAIQLYWIRRGSWWRVKVVLSLCRRVYERILFCKRKVSRMSRQSIFSA